MLEFINSGGGFMWAILGLSIIALAIIIERFFALSFSYSHQTIFFKTVIHYVRLGNLHAAMGLCYRTSHPLAKVVIELLKNHARDKDTLESAASLNIQKIVPHIQKRTPYLAMIGNVATLVGLLGTIQGLILSFTSLSGASAASKAELLAKGISTAMNTTAFGLIVAIPCIIFFTILTNKENSILGKYEETVNEVIHIIAYDQKGQAPAHSGPQGIIPGGGMAAMGGGGMPPGMGGGGFFAD